MKRVMELSRRENKNYTEAKSMVQHKQCDNVGDIAYIDHLKKIMPLKVGKQL